MTGVFKTTKSLAPQIMGAMLNTKPNNYNSTVKSGVETISYRAPLLWSLLPEKINSLKSLDSFRKVIKKWTCDVSPSKLSKPHTQYVGLIEIYSSN